MDVICADGKFSADQMLFFREKKISVPIEERMYTIREVRREYGKVDQNDNIGFLLEEIKNPKVDCYHPILGKVNIEPSFSSKRFRTLQGDEITSEMLSLMLKNQSHGMDRFILREETKEGDLLSQKS